MIKSWKDLKFRIEEARGAIAGMIMEKEKLQFDWIRLDLEAETDFEEGTKETILKQLDIRLKEANEAYRNLNNMIKEGPSSKIDLGNVQGVDAREERAERV